MNFIACFFAFLFFVSPQAHSQQGGANSPPPAKLFGEATLGTNGVEKGISQTDKSMAYQATVGYRWPQFQLSLWGSNVKFAGEEETLNLRLRLSARLDFTQNVSMSLIPELNRYYKVGGRNGTNIALDFSIFSYHVIYEKYENFMGLGADNESFSFAKTWQLTTFLLGAKAGYNMMKATGYANFFDVRGDAGYKLGDFLLNLAVTYNSSPNQFNGLADLSYLFEVKVRF